MYIQLYINGDLFESVQEHNKQAHDRMNKNEYRNGEERQETGETANIK